MTPGAPKVCPRCGIPTVPEHAITDERDECLDALRTALAPFLEWGAAEEAPGPRRLAYEHRARTHARRLAALLTNARR